MIIKSCGPLKLRNPSCSRGPDINKLLLKFEWNEYANFYEQVMYTQNIQMFEDVIIF